MVLRDKLLFACKSQAHERLWNINTPSRSLTPARGLHCGLKMPEELFALPNVPEGLREAARRGLLVPFVGAGVSRLAGCPSWVEFADAVLRSLIQAGKFSYSQLDQIRNLNPRVKLSFARRLALDSKVPIDYKALLHSVARSDHNDGCRIYRSLFALGNIFVTTNYDEWLDERIPDTSATLTPSEVPSNTSAIMPMHVVHRVNEFVPRSWAVQYCDSPSRVCSGSRTDDPDDRRLPYALCE